MTYWTALGIVAALRFGIALSTLEDKEKMRRLEIQYEWLELVLRTLIGYPLQALALWLLWGHL